MATPEPRRGANGVSPKLLERNQSVVLLESDVAMAVIRTDLDSLVSQCSPLNKDSMALNMDGFMSLFERYLGDRESGNTVNWSKLRPLPDEAVINYDTIVPANLDKARELLNKLVVLKLNGGLGTSMGCVGPKSVIQVRNDATFLDLTVQQIEHLNRKYNVRVPLVLMNSFNTQAETMRVKHKYERRVPLYLFEQSCYPRINQETLRPLPEDTTIRDGQWYPPGHGDVYASLKRSGLLADFTEEGKEVIFISNIDNLGATVDLNILSELLNSATCEFMMEVTDKTRSDVKGGTLIKYKDRVQLLEIAQVPKDHVDDFKSISRFKIFNTNNLWAKLDAIDRLIREGNMTMDVITNKKTTSDGTNVIQLETAAGAAIKNFSGAIGVNVPRSRFLPVKKTSDLLVVMSNLFKLKDGTLVRNPARSITTLPLVKLGDQHFSKVREFLRRFDNIPDMLELDHLTVSGDVTFGKNVVLKGTVIIIANHGDRIDIPAGAYLENKIVSGNLRILDH